MIKFKILCVLVVLISLSGIVVSQYNAEWSEENEEYSDQSDETFKNEDDGDDYENFIAKLKEASDRLFELSNNIEAENELQIEDTRFDGAKDNENNDYEIGDENMNGNAPINDYENDENSQEANGDDVKDNFEEKQEDIEPYPYDGILRVNWNDFDNANENFNKPEGDEIGEINGEAAEIDEQIEEFEDENMDDDREKGISLKNQENGLSGEQNIEPEESVLFENQDTVNNVIGENYQKNSHEVSEPIDIPEDILEETVNILKEDDDENIEQNYEVDRVEENFNEEINENVDDIDSENVDNFDGFAQYPRNEDSDENENYVDDINNSKQNEVSQEKIENFEENDGNRFSQEKPMNILNDGDEIFAENDDQDIEAADEGIPYINDQIAKNNILDIINEEDVDNDNNRFVEQKNSDEHTNDSSPNVNDSENSEQKDRIIDINNRYDEIDKNEQNEDKNYSIDEQQEENAPYNDEAADKSIENTDSKKDSKDTVKEQLEIHLVENFNDDNDKQGDDIKFLNFIGENDEKIMDDFNESNIIPINYTLSLDQAVIITSPNFPEPYKTSVIVDWYFYGDEGTGIELNITSFDVNSGDYLLVKPGRNDIQGDDGFIFTYSLTQDRRYRFLDVDKMYVRFESKGENPENHTGFQFSVKFIEPKADGLSGPEPVPEAVAQQPSETLTLHLSGFRQHSEVSEQFRDILEDMVAMYVGRQGIDGDETFVDKEVQLVLISACNVNWPDSHSCAAVTFGVTIQLADSSYELTTEQLDQMWSFYSAVDPFAIRLRLLGISEYLVPNDRAVISSWLIASVAVLVLVSCVGCTIFRFNCFKDYHGMTRLKEETDSIGSGRKSSLSLYPTPHQNLPPMFADEKYDQYLDGDFTPDDDSTRVDMGGAFRNKSFVKDGELMDLDSDEEIVMSLPDDGKAPKRQSYSSAIRPRDIYDV